MKAVILSVAGLTMLLALGSATLPTSADEPTPIACVGYFTSGPDTDCDGFADSTEVFVGTVPTVKCAETWAGNNETPDKGPADFNDDSRYNTLDLVTYVTTLNSAASLGPPYRVRNDLNASGNINTLDLTPFVLLLGTICVP